LCALHTPLDQGSFFKLRGNRYSSIVLPRRNGVSTGLPLPTGRARQAGFHRPFRPRTGRQPWFPRLRLVADRSEIVLSRSPFQVHLEHRGQHKSLATPCVGIQPWGSRAISHGPWRSGRVSAKAPPALLLPISRGRHLLAFVPSCHGTDPLPRIVVLAPRDRPRSCRARACRTAGLVPRKLRGRGAWPADLRSSNRSRRIVGRRTTPAQYCRHWRG
jgi:hypothetical protein